MFSCDTEDILLRETRVQSQTFHSVEGTKMTVGGKPTFLPSRVCVYLLKTLSTRTGGQ